MGWWSELKWISLRRSKDISLLLLLRHLSLAPAPLLLRHYLFLVSIALLSLLPTHLDFPNPQASSVKGKENRKEMMKNRGALASYNALIESLRSANNDGNGNQSSSSPHTPQSPEKSSPINQ
jgi:hypothetical protein